MTATEAEAVLFEELLAYTMAICACGHPRGMHANREGACAECRCPAWKPLEVNE